MSPNPNPALDREISSLGLPLVILVTVNEHETSSLLDVFLGEGQVPSQLTKEGVTYSLLGTHGGLRIVSTICEMGAVGIGASQQRTREAIDHWLPRAIISVGVAFGMDEVKQSIGDVLVSTQIQDYELGRLNDNGIITPRSDRPSCTDLLRNRLRQTDLTERRRYNNNWPKVRFGLILSGQKLVDNLDYRESLKGLFPEAIGGEMEGTGVYVSASAAKTDWIIVKGICDWGHDKNLADKDVWQKLAAKNAALVVKASLGLAGLYEVQPATVIGNSDELIQETREAYRGETVSLNFQNVDVRRLLEVIGEFTGMNMVMSDSVSGAITLTLKDVPWDQALDVIMHQKGLGMRRNGNVILIAPRDEMAITEMLELERRIRIDELTRQLR